jgi:rhodanese-related sulfurtransferase
LLAGAVEGQSLLARWQWIFVEKKIRREFPEVDRISTDELSRWLADSHRAHPVLLDVRTGSEFSVSHLAGAQNVAPETEPALANLPSAKDTPIVTYCSVGYRSAAFARKLQIAGFTDVRNLEGSIFQWANEERPLVDAKDERTRKVHPYDAFWARLLKADCRAPL